MALECCPFCGYYARTDAVKADYLAREQAVKVARANARLSLP